MTNGAGKRGTSSARNRKRPDSAANSAQKESVMSNSDDASQPRIARIWRGRTTRERADEYARYLYEQGIKPLEEKALGVQMFREDRANESEFVTISYWESVQAMSRFAGDDPTRIHHLERDAEFLIELPRSVQILDIVASSGRCTAGGEQR
jgi:heme-degrading monooxygenase HmoA